MPRACALINKETLAYICMRIGVTKAFLAQRTKISEAKVAEWLTMDNTSLPTITQAKMLAKVLRIPFAGLYMNIENLDVKRLPALKNLRTMPDGFVIDDSALNLAIVDLIRARDFLHHSEEELDMARTPLSLPLISEEATAAEFAEAIRAFFGLELAAQFKAASARQFYFYVRRRIESKGIFIQSFTGVEVAAVRGIAVFDEENPIIGINSEDRYPAKTFSIIHELVHVIKRQSTLCNDMYSSFSVKSEEVFCNAVAGEVLVPAASLGSYLSTHEIAHLSLDDIQTIAAWFSVSREVITRRLYDSGRISKCRYDTITNEIRLSFVQEHEAAKMARAEGRARAIPRIMSREAVDQNSTALCRLLLIGYGEGYFSKQDLSGHLGIKEKHISKFLAEVAKW